MSDKFSKIYEKSIKEPENFWKEAANDIFWFKKPSKILNKSNPPFYKWYEDGVSNTCYNALDIHIDQGKGKKTALIYDSPITGNKSKFTYEELRSKVSKFAGALSNQGVKKGDRVFFSENSEYDMNINGESLLRMRNFDILGVYEGAE